MAGEGLSIGVLSGRIDLDDNFTATITLSNEALEKLKDTFGGVNRGVKDVAVGMFTAEAAIHAVEKIAHLAVDTLKELTITGAEIGDVESNFNRLAEGAERSGEVMMGVLREGTRNTITDFELMKLLTGDLTAGMNLTDKQFKTLAEGGFAIAQARGMKVQEVIETINQAMLTGRVRTVAYLAGKIDLGAAEERLATQLGTTADKLNEEGKIQAARLAILEKVEQATARLGEQTLGLDEQVDQIITSWHNFMEELGKTVATSPVVLKAFSDIRIAISDALGVDQEHLIEAIVHQIENLATTAVKATNLTITVLQTGMKIWEDYGDVIEIVAVGLGTYVVAAKAAETWTALLGLTALSSGGKLTTLGGALFAMKALDFTNLAGARVSLTLLGEAAVGAVGPLGAVAIAAAAIFAAWKVGQMEPVSDFFEKIGLRLSGLTAAEADARIASDKLNMSLIEQGKSHDKTADSAEEFAAQQKRLMEETQNAVTQQRLQNEVLDKNKLVMEQTATEIKKLDEAWADLALVGNDYKETLKTIDKDTLGLAQHYLEAGASISSVKTAFELTDSQTKALTDSLKANAEALKLEEVTAAALTKVWAEYIERKSQFLATDNERIEAKAKRDFDVAVADAKKRGIVDVDYYNALWALRNQDVEVAKFQTDEIVNNSKQGLEIALRNAKEKLENARASGLSLSQVYIKELTDNVKKAEEALADFGSTAGDAFDKTTVKVRTLNGELITLEEHQKRQNQGGSTIVNRGNLAEYAKYWGIPDTLAFEMAKKGFSFQEMVDAFQSGMIDQWKPSGPRIQGFGLGGVVTKPTIAMVGERGPEVIIPLNRPGGFGGNVTMTFNVNGTAMETARAIKDHVMRELKFVKQFPGA